MIKLFVDELPNKSKDCPFSIIDTYPCICKLMLNHEDEYNNITNATNCSCVLERYNSAPCPFLRKLKFY